MKKSILILGLLCVCGFSAIIAVAQEATGGIGVGPTIAGVDSQGIKNYLLGPGDTLDVRVFGLPEMNWQGEVTSDGTITLPFIDTPIMAQCRSEKEVQKDIVTGYTKFLKSPQISVRITNRSSRSPATVYGAVKVPSRVSMLRSVRLNELIAVSGGLTERANGTIQVFHTEKVLCPSTTDEEEPIYDDNGSIILKLFKINDLYSGKPESNPLIRPGDVVTVMEAEPIYIVGGIATNQPVLMRDGLTLTDALAQVGGVIQDAKITDIKIHRATKPGATISLRERTTIKADLKAIAAKKADDVLLQPYDIIEVPMKSRWTPEIFGRDLLGGLLGILPRSNLPAMNPRVIR
jgi:polysaccharide biosynthesis/export protein